MGGISDFFKKIVLKFIHLLKIYIFKKNNLSHIPFSIIFFRKMKIIKKIIKFYHNLAATLKGVLRFFYFHILNKLPNLAKTFL
jgi:hypothetical protein